MKSELKMQRASASKEELQEILTDAKATQFEGYEEALIGHSVGANPKAIYDVKIMVDIHVKRDHMTFDEAWEFLEFNAFSQSHPTQRMYDPIFLYPFN